MKNPIKKLWKLNCYYRYEYYPKNSKELATFKTYSGYICDILMIGGGLGLGAIMTAYSFVEREGLAGLLINSVIRNIPSAIFLYLAWYGKGTIAAVENRYHTNVNVAKQTSPIMKKLENIEEKIENLESLMEYLYLK